MILIEFVFMLVIDLLFMVALVVLMLPLGIWRQAAFAVMKRNFVGYFSNPTGYVFLCLFVLLTSFAAFWPHEFFTTNLANFDQLNKFLPYIMLVFIPAITMSLWAEERRQGTDELLLTLPAKDFDIVIGKYFAAVLVFTVSLLFSQLSNYAVLLAMTGGQLDNLLLFSTYLGYWFVGVAMISLGMVASFLTSNLTVGFIIGAALNAPLAFFSNADVIFSSSKWIQRLYEWSLLQRFEPFGRGLISASSVCYFLGIAIIGIYLSLVLIGRRHWLGGRDGNSMGWHYLVRSAFLIAMVIAGVLIVQHSPLNRARVDISDAQVSTLAPETVQLLERLAVDRGDGDLPPIVIDAYVSGDVPSEYVKTRYDLVNLLREFDVLGGAGVEVNLRQGIEPFSEEAINAEKRFGIRARRIQTQSRGALREEEVILGVAVSSGLERIVIPFLSYGMPVEYELMRSINTVASDEKKTVGFLVTDALVNGATISAGGRAVRIEAMAIVAELEKQYNVEMVDASSEISLSLNEADSDDPQKRRYDVIVAVQPSKTTPTEMANFIAAIEAGQPTLILEDPFPQRETFPHIPGTFFPRPFARSSSATANVDDLFETLELDIDRVGRTLPGGQKIDFPFIVWQSQAENPYKRDNSLQQPEQVIVSEANTAPGSRFAQGVDAVRGITEILFPFAGDLKPKPDSQLDFEPLVFTGNAGRVLLSDLLSATSDQQLLTVRGAADQSRVLVAQITNPDDAGGMNVIYVADIDLISDALVRLKNEPIRNSIEYHFQNVSFILNAVDALAGETLYLNLRTRHVRHATLETIEATYKDSLDEVHRVNNASEIDFQNALNTARAEIEEKTRSLVQDIDLLNKRKDANEPYDAAMLAAKQTLLETERREQTRKFEARRQELDVSRQEARRRTSLKAELEIQRIQRRFKLFAVLIPPIPPLLVGLIVFTRRRLREREGISKARRLK